jgi:hypothetical protein
MTEISELSKNTTDRAGPDGPGPGPSPGPSRSSLTRRDWKFGQMDLAMVGGGPGGAGGRERVSRLTQLLLRLALLAQQRRRQYVVSLPHILQPQSGPSSQRLADFLRDLSPSSGDCAVNSDSIRATLVSAEVPETG